MLSFILLFLWGTHLFAQDEKKALQTIAVSESTEKIEVQHASKRGKEVPCTIDFWEGDYILVDCKVSANDKESLDYFMKKENPFEIDTQIQKKTMILKITGTDRTIIKGGKEIQFYVEYEMLIPKSMEVFNQELISK